MNWYAYNANYLHDEILFVPLFGLFDAAFLSLFFFGVGYLVGFSYTERKPMIRWMVVVAGTALILFLTWQSMKPVP